MDSNAPVLFGIDSVGNHKRAIQINSTNRGWEDLAKDDFGNFYIGDFGNNFNNRKNLKIYKIPSPDSIAQKIVTPEVIEFTYADQQAFPPPPSLHQFDMDAMIYFEESLYLFSKNRTKPYTGYTKMYRLPAIPGKYTAELLDSIYLGPGGMLETWVTGADMSPDKKTLALLSHDKIWLFQCFENNNFFKGKKTIVPLHHYSQKEGICFVDNENLLITDERTANLIGGSLYTFKIPNTYNAKCN